MTTTGLPPMRPRGAARHAANLEAAAAAEGFPTRRARRAAEAGVTASETRRRRAARHDAVAHDRAVRPHDAERHHQTTGAAATTPAASVTTAPGPTTDRARVDPPRVSRASRPAADSLARSVTQAITLPLRSIGHAVASARAVPVTATAVAACLFVTVATPQPALAAPPRAVLPALDAQRYSVAAGDTIPVLRDAFAIGGVPIRMPGAPPPSTDGAAPSVRPVAGAIPAAGGFGSRWVRGCASCSTNHQGLDFAAPTGTAVVAAMSGRVVSAGVFGGYGNQVLLQHADGSQTRYGHLSQIGVGVGQAVAAGEQIGAVGNTGVSTGSHLHFEVIVGGTPVDPAVWLLNRGLL